MQTFTYKQVEAALAETLGVADDRRGVLDARIKHFFHLRHLGVRPSSPGKGKRIAYEFPFVLRWGLILTLEGQGISPMEAIKIADSEHITAATASDHLLVCRRALGGEWEVRAARRDERRASGHFLQVDVYKISNDLLSSLDHRQAEAA